MSFEIVDRPTGGARRRGEMNWEEVASALTANPDKAARVPVPQGRTAKQTSASASTSLRRWGIVPSIRVEGDHLLIWIRKPLESQA